MKANWTLLPAALLVAMLALAGCGGGSDDTPVDPPVDTTPPPDPGPAALETSAGAKNAALAARKEAMALLAGARAASGNISTAKVDGDSRLAERNAATVLAATALIMAEETKAAAAVATAEGVDTTGLTAAQQNSIAADVMAAKDALAEIQAILADTSANSLMKIVEALMGTSTDATKVAAARNKAVASAIKTAIANTGLATGTTFFASVDYDLVPKGQALMRAGTPGRTFREITGGDSIRAKNAKAATYGVAADVTSIPAATPLSTDIAWKGIPGELTCVGTVDCTIENGEIRGTVHFVPADPRVFYAPTDDGSGYMVTTNGAVYGYWLDGTTIEHHAESRSDDTQGAAGNLDGLNWTRNDLAADGSAAVTRASDLTAAYDGTAGGFSERTIGTGATAQSASGHFVADASLKATFGETDAAISGTIRNFSAATGSTGSGHVNSNWVVALSPINADGSAAPRTANFTNGAIDTDHEYRSGEVGATGGGWSANAYGAPLKRPTGFVGAFNASFMDGSAAGVYHVDAE